MVYWGILRIILLIILNIAQGQKYTPRCDESASVISYWKYKYEIEYYEKDEPVIRCDKSGGFCLTDDKKCVGDKKHWQTTCDDKCICCFGTEQVNNKRWDLMKKKKTWKDAQEYCRGKQGEMLVPQNIWDVILFLRDEQMGMSDVWVGINDIYQGSFEGVYGNYISSGWKDEQPQLAADTQGNCVVVEDEPDDPGMKVEPCIARNYFICDFTNAAKSKGRYPIFLKQEEPIKKKKVNKFTSWDKIFHKTDAAKYGGNIQIVPMRLTWKRARAECRSRGGDLHIPPSIGDMIMYMRDERVGSRDVWIGYSDIYSDGVYEGVQHNALISGWQRGQPIAMQPGQDCIAVEDDKKVGIGMKVDPCEQKNMFICDTSEEFRSNHNTTE